MKEEDVVKREEKEKNTDNPELLGFKRISVDIAAVEPYEIGSLSPSNERVSVLWYYWLLIIIYWLLACGVNLFLDVG